MLDHMVQYAGSSPDASPAILTAIGHMQMQEGIWYPMGRMRAVPEALVKLATELGVIFHSSTDVAKILTTSDRHEAVMGLVTTTGQTYAFDAIVSNEDAVRTHRELLARTSAAREFEHKRTYEPTYSGVALYLGLKKRYEHLAHHDFVFSRGPHEEFHHIYDLGEPAPANVAGNSGERRGCMDYTAGPLRRSPRVSARVQARPGRAGHSHSGGHVAATRDRVRVLG
jgi:phytoene dehydrogenase-like protein